MHPRQASLLNFSESVMSRVAKRGGKKQSEAKQGGANLFEYTCSKDESHQFYLTVKQTSGVKCPLCAAKAGGRPEKETLADLGKELKNKGKKAALMDILAGMDD